MAAVCATCGAKLGFGRRLSGKDVCESCEHKSELAAEAASAARARALVLYRNEAVNIALSDTGATELQAVAQQSGLDSSDVVQANRDAYTAIISKALEDENMTADEEASLNRASVTLGLPDAERTAIVRSFGNRVWIARTNAGNLSPIPETSIMLKRAEQAYLEVPATLLKETVHRQTQGGYSGVSIRIAKGVRFNTGGYRGHLS